MNDNVFFDTNILIYAHDFEAPLKQSKAEGLILNHLVAGTGFLSTQVLSEFYVTVTRKIKQPLTLKAAKKELSLLSKFQVVEINVSMINLAIDIQNKYQLSYWDSLILSAAQKSHCSILYSEDLSHEQSINKVKILNPFRALSN